MSTKDGGPAFPRIDGLETMNDGRTSVIVTPGMTPRAFERIENWDERGLYSVLYAVDVDGEIELDYWPCDGHAGDARTEAVHLNANPDELRQCIIWARTKTGPWSPRKP